MKTRKSVEEKYGVKEEKEKKSCKNKKEENTKPVIKY